ncbi:hypothetical protein C1645_811932 [Glomus cerebriforme]|uniref:Uncharacterized protein n=1 Tax=Glomus cerebriforme TaxID=658196 RepID=A0A397TP08_9GLOM|nr:hypothetical protein C1645_811932 [Glomus cerebriforme]
MPKNTFATATENELLMLVGEAKKYFEILENEGTFLNLVKQDFRDIGLAINISHEIWGCDKKSQSHKKREAEDIVQDVFDFTATLASEKNYTITPP